MKLKFLAMIAVLALTGFYLAQAERVEAAGGALPPWPVIYTGDVTLGGEPVPDGMWVFATMEGYTSTPVEVKSGRIAGLAAGGPDTSYFNKIINFELSKTEIYDAATTVVAEETDVFVRYATPFLKSDFSLTFGAFPTPTPLPTATPTVTPIPTATPLATATPVSVGPIVYSGMIVASGGVVPDGSSLSARVGDYSSEGVEVKNGQFISLIIDLDDPSYTGAEVTFYLDGIQARTTAKYEVGSTIRNIDLIFMDLPDVATSTPLPMPTTPPSPTSIPVVEAEKPTEVPTTPPEPTVASPVETPTPIILVVTATPPPEQPEPPVVVKDGEGTNGGGCNAVSNAGPVTGAANVLAMIGPILLLAGYRGVRKIL